MRSRSLGARLTSRALWLASALALAACSGSPMAPDDTPTDLGAADPDLATVNPNCNAQNCAGCCLGDACQPGNTTSGCGKQGAQCAACLTVYQICLPAQSCGLDPAQRWLVKAVNATINPTNSGGSAWDPFGGDPDAFVEFKTASGSKNTSSSDDTLSPTWNQGFAYSAQELTTSGLKLRVWDSDPTSANDAITNERTVVFTEADFAKGRIEIMNWDGVKMITFLLERN